MRQKELRLALVCYGGVSLAVYMHGVTKEIWQLARASREFNDPQIELSGVARVYQRLLETIEQREEIRIRVLPDILTGASAGGINAVFLAQAAYTGQSLEPLTRMWLDHADVERLLDPEARPWWRFAKFWAQPIASWILRRPGNIVSESVAPETRREVRRKVSRFVRGRWFQPPFSGIGFSTLLLDALGAMAKAPCERPLLPPGHPIDLYVTATDFRGHLETLRLHSPPQVEESEHRMPISFSRRVARDCGTSFAHPLELCLAARATASFPGAFPPLRLAEIDELAQRRALYWDTRGAFLARVMPVHVREGIADHVSLIDGSVLVNAPFAGAIASLKGRPAQREVDRRFVYIDPRPDRYRAREEDVDKPVGFFEAIFGSLSTIPREQPIRDNLETLERQSRHAERLQRIVKRMRPEIDRAVEKLFGRTFFLDKPTPKRLKAWRAKAQDAAAKRADFAFASYLETKFAGIIDHLIDLAISARGEQADHAERAGLRLAFEAELRARGLDNLNAPSGGASEAAIAFFRAHDLRYRVRRMRLIAQRLSRDWEADPDIDDEALDRARDAIYEILALYFEREGVSALGDEAEAFARGAIRDPGALIDFLAERRLLVATDEAAEEMFAAALEAAPRNLRRRMLLTYLGFPFYDVATLSLLQNEGLTEYDPVKVDRISPDDARSICEGGTGECLRGTEFYNFGAFFSRAYRENDYLWGRLHGAERLIEIVLSTLPKRLEPDDIARFKRKAFLAIIEEEREAGLCAERLIERLHAQIVEKMG